MSENSMMTVERLQAFGQAWGRGDVETLMSYMADDCVYSASVGPEPGRTYSGRDNVRRGFEALLAHDAGAESRTGPCYVYGDRGVALWCFVYRRDGVPVEVHGCDLFEFAGDRIRVKNAFRKTFG